MKDKRLNCRITDRRNYKLLFLSVEMDRTISSLVDEWIDSLPEPRELVTAEDSRRRIHSRCAALLVSLAPATGVPTPPMTDEGVLNLEHPRPCGLSALIL